MSSRALEMYQEVLRKHERRVLEDRFLLQVADLDSDIEEISDFASKSLVNTVQRVQELEKQKQCQ